MGLTRNRWRCVRNEFLKNLWRSCTWKSQSCSHRIPWSMEYRAIEMVVNHIHQYLADENKMNFVNYLLIRELKLKYFCSINKSLKLFRILMGNNHDINNVYQRQSLDHIRPTIYTAFRTKILPFWHNSPVNPGKQMHWNPLIKSIHLPSFRQGLVEHSLIFIWHLFPVQPGGQLQTNDELLSSEQVPPWRHGLVTQGLITVEIRCKRIKVMYTRMRLNFCLSY